MQTSTSDNDQLAQFVAQVAQLSALVRDQDLATRLGPGLVVQVQGMAAAVRQRFIAAPPAS